MDVNTLSKAMGGQCSIARYNQLLPAFNEALVLCNATTVARVAMVVGQVSVEAEGLLWMEEIASGAEYEGRVDLGNIHPGDGRRFKGRGPIQITGRHNYTAVSAWAYSIGKVPTKTFFVDHPELLASDKYGFLGLVWYWTKARNMNAYADAKNIVGATRAVNGGTNGLAKRTMRWTRALALGSALLPSSSAIASANPVQAVTLPQAATKRLQTVLKVAADGIIGPATLTAWQKRMGTVADGVVSSPRSSLVSAVQSYLNAIRQHVKDPTAAWPALMVDGEWGPHTASAVSAYLTLFNGGFTTGH